MRYTLRGGLEYLRRLRVTLFYDYVNKNVNYLGLNFALTFGGR